MIRPDFIISPFTSLDYYINASPVCDEIYDELLALTDNNRQVIERTFYLAWWTCALTYMYPHPEFLVPHIRETYKKDTLVENSWIVEEVVTILLLTQPNLNRFQWKFLRSWSDYYNSNYSCSFDSPSIIQLRDSYFQEENQGKEGIFFLDIYPSDAYVLSSIQEEKLQFSREDAVALMNLMHRFQSKELMYDLIACPDGFPFDMIDYYDLCFDKYGVVGQNVFNFYLPDEKVLRKLDRWVGRITIETNSVVAGDLCDYRNAAIEREFQAIDTWKKEAGAENAATDKEAENHSSTINDDEIEQLKQTIETQRQTIASLELELEVQQASSSIEKPSVPNETHLTCGPYSIRDGKKTDFIKVIHILNELQFFEKEDGKDVSNRNDLINAFLDKKSNISKLLNDALKTNTYINVFNDILDKASKVYGEDNG